MIRQALRMAHRWNEALSDFVGRPYHAMLGGVLVVAIIQRVRALFAAPATGHGYVWTALTVAFGLILLLDQLADLSERLERRRLSRSAENKSP